MVNETGNTIPKHWQLKKLGEVFKVVTGTTPSKNNQDFYGTDYPFYKPTDLEQGINTIYARDGLTKSGLANGRFLPKDSVLVTCIGATIGKTGLIKKEGSCNQQINAVLPNKDFHPSFIYYQIISERFQRLIKSNAASTTLPILNKSKFEKLQIVIPPLPEQHAIVSKIEELFSELDNGKQQLQTALQQLKVYRQSLLKAAFEGKLTNKNVKDGELPEGWKTVNLNSISRVVSGFAFKSSDFTTEGVPVIKISNIGYSEFIWKDQQYLPNKFLKDNSDFIIEGGDLLIALTRPITNNTTKVCLYPTTETKALLNQRVAVIKDLKVTQDFIYLFFQTNIFKEYIRSNFSETLQPNLSPKDLALTPIPLPSIEEQQLIVQELESKLTVCDKIEETINQSLQQAEALRQSILKKAFEGKLVSTKVKEVANELH
jgi:type I restriction enzyme, S subunit